MTQDGDTQTRLKKILQGAFAGPPTPLKDIPTRNGESRKLQRKSLSGACVASARTAPPET
jgi:hypothetical protein